MDGQTDDGQKKSLIEAGCALPKNILLSRRRRELESIPTRKTT